MANLTQTFIKQIQDALDWIIGKGSGMGIRVDVDDPTFPWHDLLGRVEPSTSSNPQQAPEMLLFKSSGGASVYSVGFIGGQDANCTFHMPHDYLPGSDLFLHAHWSHNGNAISGNVGFRYEVSYASRHDSEVIAEYRPSELFIDPIAIAPPAYPAVNIAQTPAYRHYVHETQLSAPASGSILDSDKVEVDGIILVRVFLIEPPNVSGGTLDNGVFIFNVDLHYQSTGIGTKKSFFPFYGS